MTEIAASATAVASPFSAAPPEWQEAAAPAAVDSSAEEDPFAAAPTQPDGIPDAVDAFSSGFEQFAVPSNDEDIAAASPADASVEAPAGVMAAASSELPPSSSSPDPDPAPLMPDSLEYIAALERRLARLHTRKQKGDYKRTAAGAEFIGAAATNPASRSQQAQCSASAAATTSWLDLPDSVPPAQHTPTDDPASSAAYHSSEDEEYEDEEGRVRRRRRVRPALPVELEERVALLSQHAQRAAAASVAQLQAAQQAAVEAASAHAHEEQGDEQTPAVAAVASTATVPPDAATPAANASVSAAPTDGDEVVAYAIESSDGDETGAPKHTWRPSTSLPMAAGAAGDGSGGSVTSPEPVADVASGVIRGRALYYEGSAAVASVGTWIEESEQCVIA